MDENIRIMKNLYNGSSFQNETKIERIKECLTTKPENAGVFVIVLFEDSEDQLYILNCTELTKDYYRRKNPWIIGIAKDEDEAVAVIQSLLQETYKAKGNAEMKAYLLMREEYSR